MPVRRRKMTGARKRKPGRPRRVGRPRLTGRARPRRTRRLTGRGFVSGLKSLISKAHTYAKDNRLLSRGIGLIKNSHAQHISKSLAMNGYRPRRRRVARRRPMRGRGFFGNLWSGVKSVGSKIGNFVKDQKLISKGLALIPHAGAQAAAKVAGQVGLRPRRRRRVARRRTVRRR